MTSMNPSFNISKLAFTAAKECVAQLAEDGITLSQFLRALAQMDGSHSPLIPAALDNLAINLPSVLDAWRNRDEFSGPLMEWSVESVSTQCSADLLNLARAGSRFHSPAKDITEEKILDFDIDDYASELEREGSTLWRVFGSLFDTVTPRAAYVRNWRHRRAEEAAGGSRASRKTQPRQVDVDMEDVGMDSTMHEDGVDSESDLDEPIDGITAEGDEEPEDLPEQMAERRKKNSRVVSTLLNKVQDIEGPSPDMFN